MMWKPSVSLIALSSCSRSRSFFLYSGSRKSGGGVRFHHAREPRGAGQHRSRARDPARARSIPRAGGTVEARVGRRQARLVGPVARDNKVEVAQALDRYAVGARAEEEEALLQLERQLVDDLVG